VSFPEALERAAEALPELADEIRPANGDAFQLLSTLDDVGSRAVLGWLLAHEPAAGEELLGAWCEDDRGVSRVQAMDVSALPKAGKKVLRRALHRLRTIGVDLAASKPVEPVVSKLSVVEDEIEGAYMTSLDPGGAVLLFLVEANPAGGARLFQVLLDERRGVVEFHVYTTGRSRARSFLRKLTAAAASGSSGAVEVDGGVARGLVARIARAHPANRPFPAAFSEWRRKLEAGASDVTPASAVRTMLGDATGADALDRVAARVERNELGPWPPDSNRLTEVSACLGETMNDIVALQGPTRDEALDVAVADAARSFFDDGHAAHTVSRFEVNAYWSALAGREEEARDQLKAAAAFSGPDCGTNSIACKMTERLTASVLERAAAPESRGDDRSPLATDAS